MAKKYKGYKGSGMNNNPLKLPRDNASRIENEKILRNAYIDWILGRFGKKN